MRTSTSGAEQVRTVRAGATSFLLRTHEQGGADGTPVLLLHGVPETSSSWAAVAAGLAGERRVLVPDLPGLGGSTYTGPYDSASLAAELAALLEAEVGGCPVDVVGHDWGGILALALAEQRAELVRRLVVVNAPFREVSLLRAVHIPIFSLPVLPELAFRLSGRRLVELMLDLAWRAPHRLDEARRAEYAAAYTEPGALRAMLGYYRAAFRPRLAARLRREPDGPPPTIDVEKAMVLWGALDPVLPISVGEAVVRDLGADCVMVTVPGAGHFVVEEAPDIVLEVLLDFLADERTAPVTPAAPPEKAEQAHEPIEPPAGAGPAPVPAGTDGPH